MKAIKFIYNNKQYNGILVNEISDLLEIKLKNGYNILIPSNEVDILEEHAIEEVKITKTNDIDEDVIIISTGGTIASSVDYGTGAVSPNLSSKDLLSFMPELKKLNVSIGSYSLFNMFSEDISQKHWEKMAEIVYELMKNDKKVIIMHGTDTMHYSASALGFALLNKSSPIVFVGAQRSSDRPSTDAYINLVNAIFTSLQSFGESVIVMHASSSDNGCYVHRGVRTRKMHTSRRDAFKSINSNPLAYANFYENIFDIKEKLIDQKQVSYNNGFSKSVALVYYFPGMDANFLNYLERYNGVVLMGTGLGHIGINENKELYMALKELAEKRIVVITSQTLYGRINLNVYSTGRKIKALGVLGNELDITPESAYVKLSWIIDKERDKEKVSKMFYTNYIYEFSYRSKY